MLYVICKGYYNNQVHRKYLQLDSRYLNSSRSSCMKLHIHTMYVVHALGSLSAVNRIAAQNFLLYAIHQQTQGRSSSAAAVTTDRPMMLESIVVYTSDVPPGVFSISGSLLLPHGAQLYVEPRVAAEAFATSSSSTIQSLQQQQQRRQCLGETLHVRVPCPTMAQTASAPAASTVSVVLSSFSSSRAVGEPDGGGGGCCTLVYTQYLRDAPPQQPNRQPYCVYARSWSLDPSRAVVSLFLLAQSRTKCTR